MQTQNFLKLPLQEKALLTKRDGTLLEMEDYYSYQIHKYNLDGQRIDLICDYTDQVISVEMPDKNSSDSRMDDQLESQLDD
jgi:hypothetical protein